MRGAVPPRGYGCRGPPGAAGPGRAGRHGRFAFLSVPERGHGAAPSLRGKGGAGAGLGLRGLPGSLGAEGRGSSHRRLPGPGSGQAGRSASAAWQVVGTESPVPAARARVRRWEPAGPPALCCRWWGQPQVGLTGRSAGSQGAPARLGGISVLLGSSRKDLVLETIGLAVRRAR